MKLVTFHAGDGEPKAGALSADETRVVALADADNQPYFATMLALIEAGQPALDRAGEVLDAAGAGGGIPLAEVTLLTPVPDPPQLRDFLCFEEHLINGYNMLRKKKADAEPDPEEALARFEREGVFAIPPIWYEQPVYYKPSRFGIIGTGHDVDWPPFSEALDYEMEFAAWVGTKCRDVSPEDAKGVIFGYSIFNDISARDTQATEMSAGLGPGKGKDFETGNIVGPCIVTADSFDPYNADMIVRINGEERSRGNSRDMHWKFEDCISHASRSETIYPGELFCSGTVPWGCGLEHDLYLSDGDVVELEVTGIGVLKNRVVKRK